uniref:Cystatin domain-containing protein n=1 Tax=Leersia perrieri TaxID=77586 RepID=A0A0D9VR24_9ORYZ
MYITILFAAAVAIATVFTVVAAADGPWVPVNDAHVQELGKWAVDEEQAQKGEAGLTFNRVTNGEKQEVDGGGENYRLTLEASRSGARFGRYKAMKLATMTTSSLLLAAAVAMVAVCIATAPGATAALVGGWSPIKNISDPHIQELGQWAVSEVNKKVTTRGGLKFGKVTGGEQQVVNGINYRLDIEASSNIDANGSYKAVVYEKDSTTPMSTSRLILAAVAIVAVCAAASTPGTMAAADAGDGDWSPIKNISDPHIQELSNKVTDGEQQVANGINYRLDIDASSSIDADGSYQAVVYEKDSTTRKLVTILFAAAVAIAAAFTVVAAADGPWEPVNDAHVQELGKWAVDEVQKEGEASDLTFNSVTVGEKQAADGGGVNYRLTLEASSSGAKFGRYKAVLY